MVGGEGADRAGRPDLGRRRTPTARAAGSAAGADRRGRLGERGGGERRARRAGSAARGDRRRRDHDADAGGPRRRRRDRRAPRHPPRGAAHRRLVADEGLPPVRVRVLRPLEEPVGRVVLDVDLRQPDEEPRVLPEAHGSMSAAAHPALPRSVRRTPRHVPLAVLAAAAFLPLFVTDGGIALHNMILAAAYVIMALGLNIVVGFAGLLDLGYVAFFAIGAHVAAHFGSQFWEHAHVAVLAGRPAADLPGIHLNFLLIVVAAIAACALAGVLIGVPTLRLRGDYIGIVTLAFGEIIGEAVTNGREIHFLGGYLTGGPKGMAGGGPGDLPPFRRLGALGLRPW